VELPQSAREVLESAALGHLVTIGRDGAPQVSVVWVGLDGDDLVTAHLRSQQKWPITVLARAGRGWPPGAGPTGSTLRMMPRP
jgi:hypothetical protein